MTLIIGVDPGIRYTGWGIIETNDLKFIAGGYIATNEKHQFDDRLYFLYSELTNVISKYLPDLCAIEKIFINNNPKSSIILSQTSGALLLTIKIKKLKILQFDTNAIKKAVTGNGHATKEQIRYMVGNILKCNTEFAKYDLCDALATAICCANQINSII